MLTSDGSRNWLRRESESLTALDMVLRAGHTLARVDLSLTRAKLEVTAIGREGRGERVAREAIMAEAMEDQRIPLIERRDHHHRPRPQLPAPRQRRRT